MNSVLRTAFVCCAAFLMVACEESIEKQIAAREAEHEAFKARAGEIADEATREALLNVGWSYFLVTKIGLENRLPPAEVRYDERPLAILEDYAGPADLTENFLGGLLGKNDPKYFRTSLDVIEPFDFPFEHRFDWRDVELEDGEIVAVTTEEEYEDAAERIQVIERFGDLRMFAPEGVEVPLPVRVRGEFVASPPRSVLRASLIAGDERTLGDYLVSVREIEGHYAVLEVVRADGGALDLKGADVVAGATDAEGRYLDRSGSGTGANDFYEVFGALLYTLLEAAEEGELDSADVEARLEAAAAPYQAEAEKTLVKTFYFRGEVAGLEIVLLAPGDGETSFPVEVKLDAMDAYVDDGRPVERRPMEATAYDYGLSTLMDPKLRADLSAEDVATEIVVKQERGNVYFEYPAVLSDVFLDSFSRYEEEDAVVRFFDGDGSAIALPEDADPFYDATVNRIEVYRDAFDVAPARVAGSIPVVLMPGVSIKRFEAGRTPENIAIEENMIIVSDHVNNGRRELYALDGEGRFLKRFLATTYSYEDAPSKRALYYYGEPKGVLIIERGRTETATYAFDIALEAPDGAQ